MRREEVIQIITLIIAVCALILSIVALSCVTKVSQENSKIQNTISKAKEINEKFGPLLPKFEKMQDLLDRAENYLLGVPPIKPNPPESK